MPNVYRKGPGPWCGTQGGYTNHACRCDDCKTANSAAHADYMARHPEQTEAKRLNMQRRRAARKERRCQKPS